MRNLMRYREADPLTWFVWIELDPDTRLARWDSSRFSNIVACYDVEVEQVRKREGVKGWARPASIDGGDH
jgi:hypothetical protein